MKRYNDFFMITKNYLRNLNEFKATAKIKREQVKGWQDELDKVLSVAAPIAKYSGMPGGGSPEFTTVEMSASRRELLHDRIIQAANDADKLERVVRMVECAIEALPDEDKQIITARYIDNRTWAEVAGDLHYSEKWTAQRGNKAVDKMSRVLFEGVRIPYQEKLRFVFAI